MQIGQHANWAIKQSKVVSWYDEARVNGLGTKYGLGTTKMLE